MAEAGQEHELINVNGKVDGQNLPCFMTWKGCGILSMKECCKSTPKLTYQITLFSGLLSQSKHPQTRPSTRRFNLPVGELRCSQHGGDNSSIHFQGPDAMSKGWMPQECVGEAESWRQGKMMKAGEVFSHMGAESSRTHQKLVRN